jgi:hypothetical protein
VWLPFARASGEAAYGATKMRRAALSRWHSILRAPVRFGARRNRSEGRDVRGLDDSTHKVHALGIVPLHRLRTSHPAERGRHDDRFVGAASTDDGVPFAG